MTSDRDIREKLAKLERLFAQGATPGERAVAGAARDRLQARLEPETAGNAEPEIELQYSLSDVWSLRIFVALCRKHGVRPYRYPRQRRTTVMVLARRFSFERTVAHEFHALHREVTAYFDEMVNHLIADAMKSDGDDETLEQRQFPKQHAEPSRPPMGRLRKFRAKPWRHCARRRSWIIARWAPSGAIL